MNTSPIEEKLNIEFKTEIGEDIPCLITEIRAGQNIHNQDTFFLKVEVEYTTYQSILNQNQFHLYPETLNNFNQHSFDLDKNIQLEIALKPSLALAFSEADEIIQHLSIPNKKTKFLRKETNWLAQTVVQEINYSPEFLGDGTAKIGFKTFWKTGKDDLKPNSMSDVVRFFFLENRWKYEMHSETMFRVKMKGESFNWIFLVKVDDENNNCLCYSIFPQQTIPEKRGELAESLIHLNYDIGIGNYEMDMEDGEVRFRTSLGLGKGWLSNELFDELVTLNISMMNEYGETILEKMS